MTEPLQYKMPPKGKKTAPAPFPQGKAGNKKAAKVCVNINSNFVQDLTLAEPSPREAP